MRKNFLDLCCLAVIGLFIFAASRPHNPPPLDPGPTPKVATPAPVQPVTQAQDEYNQATDEERTQALKALMSKLHNPDGLLVNKATHFGEGFMRNREVRYLFAQYSFLNKQGHLVKDDAFIFEDRGRYFVVPADNNFGNWCDKVGFETPSFHTRPSSHYR